MTKVAVKLGSFNQEKKNKPEIPKYIKTSYFSGTHFLKFSKLSKYANDNKTSLQHIRVTVTRK
jgi:hypothetical protein